MGDVEVKDSCAWQTLDSCEIQTFKLTKYRAIYADSIDVNEVRRAKWSPRDFGRFGFIDDLLGFPFSDSELNAFRQRHFW